MAVEHRIRAALPARKTRIANWFRREWIIWTLPEHDSDLTPYEWRDLEKRYMDAGGDPEELGHLIERNVLE